MKEETIQTLHPIKGKVNKTISLNKYSVIKENMFSILAKKELTHTEIMENLISKLKDKFDGNIPWYGETVKLDLEARGIIERINSKPEKYQLKK